MHHPGRIRNTFAEIHLNRLKNNFNILKGLIDPHAFFCPMVKADGYGHGDIEISKQLELLGAESVAVSLVEEGVRLRAAGVTLPILAFTFFDGLGAEEIVRFNLTPVLGSWDQVQKIKAQLADSEYYPVHLKFNTGMSRLGFEVEDSEKLFDYFSEHKELHLEGICTHLLNSEDAADPKGYTVTQQRRFQKVENIFVPMRPKIHYLNSAGILLRLKNPNPAGGVIGARPGIALYGVWPDIPHNPAVDLQPVMELKSSIGMIRHVPVGATVSYGARFKAERDSTIGVIPLGYADGYSRHLSSHSSTTAGAQMLFRGQRVPVVGTVCMDYTMVDLTDAIQGVPPKVGEEVVVFGSQRGATLSVEEVAKWAGTIPYEILTGISKRIPRVFVH